jgi:type VI secretion system secreted protein Hcp
MAIYAKIKGQKQGAVTGGVSAASFPGQIQVNTVDFGVGSPHDVSTGLATGKRVARPVTITKPMDRSSPLLHQSCTTNEVLTVDISYVVEGEGHKPYATVSLTNAMIRDFNSEANFTGSSTETITFTYTKIEFTWAEGGIVSVDDWMSST